ncbi:MAG: DNA repair exonuclease [Oscillospiraceae bacterium]|nr:DNA repair exonuclease [Oscillospiraceae bacterium]
MIKLLHAADLHLDSPFDALPEDKAATRRAEQRELLHKLAVLANNERVDAVLLSGDLLDSDKSYYETGEALVRAFEEIKAPIFIAPGNHDYYHKFSPWAALKLPEHVHVFTSHTPEAVELPNGRAVVWGAAFTGSLSGSLLTDFPTITDRSKINVMTLHGQVGAEALYNPISTEQIAATGLHYLALGHEHSRSDLRQAGDTYYAYSGCAEGRGFDETGPKGVLIAEVDLHSVSTKFVPLAGRQYLQFAVDLTDQTDPVAAVLRALPADTKADICKLSLTGEYDGQLDLGALARTLEERFYHLVLRDETRVRRDIWASAEDDTLRGLFLRKMRLRYDAGDEQEREQITWAIRFALAAMDNGEQWRT